MAAPYQFVPVRLATVDERLARGHMRAMLGKGWWRVRGRSAWAGFAAEHALRRAVNLNHATTGVQCSMAEGTYAYDLLLESPAQHMKTTCEVKTRAVLRGWTHPEKFDYVNVPMHEDREPVKDVDLVWFCWYSPDMPRTLWVLGYVRGQAEFQERAVFYRGGEGLPRGGWARGAGEYVIEVQNLRPVPRGLFKEDS